jgi:hypothetical protein
MSSLELSARSAVYNEAGSHWIEAYVDEEPARFIRAGIDHTELSIF